jgi:hypothetical protein
VENKLIKVGDGYEYYEKDEVKCSTLEKYGARILAVLTGGLAYLFSENVSLACRGVKHLTDKQPAIMPKSKEDTSGSDIERVVYYGPTHIVGLRLLGMGERLGLAHRENIPDLVAAQLLLDELGEQPPGPMPVTGRDEQEMLRQMNLLNLYYGYVGREEARKNPIWMARVNHIVANINQHLGKQHPKRPIENEKVEEFYARFSGISNSDLPGEESDFPGEKYYQYFVEHLYNVNGSKSEYRRAIEHAEKMRDEAQSQVHRQHWEGVVTRIMEKVALKKHLRKV